MTIDYFAYGSNLCLERMRLRVGETRTLGPATLDGWSLRWHKRSTDGSGKCSLLRTGRDADRVWGTLYSLTRPAKRALDRIEGLGRGYDETTVHVVTAGRRRRAATYVAAASHVDDSLRPYEWYRELVVRGAEGAGLPPAWVDGLRRIQAVSDPDPDRARSHLAALPCGSAGVASRDGTGRARRRDSGARRSGGRGS